MLPKTIDNTVKNISDRPTKEIGTTFGDIWFLVFGGVSFKADKKRIKYQYDLKRYEAELAESIESIPEGREIEPSVQTTAQALEASKYCISSEILRKMFVNLISGSMDSDYADNVHPSFPEILKQLDEKDAKLLKTLSELEDIPVIDIGVNNGDGSYTTVVSRVLLGYADMNSEECTLSAAALERAGIITITTGIEIISGELSYKPFKDLEIYKKTEKEGKKKGKGIHITEGIARLTNLGLAFVEVCVR